MPHSLDELICPPYVKGVIQQTHYSARGENVVWCIVEGVDDIEIYENFFDEYSTTMSPAQAELLDQGGYENVVKVVNDVKKALPQCLIFGICDRDYIKYVEHIEFPNNVFLTDNRDIEIMMLNSSSVNAGLKEWDALFPQKLKECIDVCIRFGYLRIYNQVFSAGCSFKRKIKMSLIWEEKSHTLKENWCALLLCSFIANSNIEVQERQVVQFIADKELENESWLDVCCGHDVLRLLQLMMVHTDKFSWKAIFNHMKSDYSYTDFKTSQLYKDIDRWAIEHKVIVLKEREDKKYTIT